MSIDLETLNSKQRQAVTFQGRRQLILAGAGSGKTRVLTTRIVYLITHCGVPARQILGVTFTNKAAEEMRHRVSSLIDQKSSKEVTLCTFHSLCLNILREEIHHLGFTKHFTLYDEKEVERLIKTLVREITGISGDLPPLGPTIEVITRARHHGLATEQITNTGSDWHDTITRELYDRLHISLRAYNAVDFDHLLTLTVKLFEDHPSVLEKYQDRYRHILIDEYQDTNPVQYRLAELLSKKHSALCVVGDDDQSIYGWRGADVEGILHFPNDSVVKLEQNYRSTNIILQAANAVISKNSKRHEKVLWSDLGQGEPIDFFYAPTEENEAEAVVYRLAKLKEKHHLNWSDIAILFRSNILSRPIETALLKHSWRDSMGRWNRGIPYELVGGTEFYERREVKDLLGYLRIIVNPNDQEALLRIINTPRRGIGDQTLDKMTTYNRQNAVPLWHVLQDLTSHPEKHPLGSELTPQAQSSLKSFVEIIEKAKQTFKTQPLDRALVELIDSINYKKAIHEEVKSEQMRNFKWENVQELVKSMQGYSSETAEGLDLLSSFVATISLDQNWNRTSNTKQKEDTVKLMTFHGAKGLEFKSCFLIGIEDHIIPHEKSLGTAAVEEERRLLYVAITRAMRFLSISLATKRQRFGKEMSSKPSRFLFDIPKEFLNITDWQHLL